MKCWPIGAAALLVACSASLPPPQPQSLDSVELDEARVTARAYEPPPATDRAPLTTSEALAYTGRVLRHHELARAERKQEAADRAVADLHHIASVLERADGAFRVRFPVGTLFRDGQVRLDAAASSKLDAVAHAILVAEGHPTVRVECDGVATSLGDGHDRFLARRRADAVAAYLASRGVDRARIHAVGLEPFHPAPGAPDWDLRLFEHDVDIQVERPVLLETPKGLVGANEITSPFRETP